MQLADLDLNKSYTYADYYSWLFEDRVELIHGKVFSIAHPNTNHQLILGCILTDLKTLLKGKNIKVFQAPFDVRFTRKSTNDEAITTVLQPDVCVICDPTKIDKRGCLGAPDLIVEILSPGNNAKELKNKYDVYEESGVREYWIVSPQDQTFLVYTSVDGKFQLSPVKTTGDVVTSVVLPGFSLDLTELFSEIDADNL
jgi:Uma2 family endonuclease